MDAYAAEKKGLEALKKLEQDKTDLAALVFALQAENAQLKAELQAKNENESEAEIDGEESKEEVKGDQRGDQTPF